MNPLKYLFTIDKNAPQPSLIAIFLIGLAQIFVWGGSFFLLAVLARPIMQEMGWSREWVYGALSLGIFISGMLLPFFGRYIARKGGREVLALSGITTAIGLVILGFAYSLPIFIIAWCVLGLAMAMGLYDALFATLGDTYGSNAKKAIVAVTLISGFCTTIVWPILAFGVSHIGWRYTCFTWAALLLITVFPIYRLSLPRVTKPLAVTNKKTKQPITIDKKIYLLMSYIFMLAAVIMTAVTVQLIDLLQEEGFKLSAAIAISALIGPTQVAARIIDLIIKLSHPIWSLCLSVVLVLCGMILIYLEPRYAALAVIIYGAGNGLRSIVRGTLPLAVLKPAEFALVMGKIARPSLLAQSLTPFVFGIILENMGASAVFLVLAIIAAISVLLTMLLTIELKKQQLLQ